MSDFKKLSLDPKKILPAIIGCSAGKKVTGPIDKDKFHEYEIEGQDGQPSALLHVYLRDDGTTTLHPKVGKNQPLSESIAQHVATHASRKIFEPRPLSLKTLPEDEWTVLIDLLREEGFEVESQPLANCVRFKVKAGLGDEVYLHRYNTGSFLMQGKPWNAYGTVVSLLSELSADKKPLIDAQLETYQITAVTSAGLLDELEQRLPCACSMLGDAVKCMFAPALAFIKIDIELPDYSAFAHPALRGLEACIKQLLLDGGGFQVKKMDGIGSYFDHARLKSGIKIKMSSHQMIGAVENFYDLYNKHRHGLFHADGVPEMSRLVETRQEAVTLIESVFHIVESNYQEIVSAKP
ncbi:MAG: hypothetical protein HHJ17_00035 [Rhodoferax sp.]|uniref:RNase LS family HEPN domain-containing protein n=1 Tax=Rhodoferax sp. TaxID=50421 RepID=UPI00180C0376|nr:RNase LS family HEPN domain-containing protein [Rhodoferax sp.]NMM11917.1 hypothetical protein [Rhodoferax sp.]